MSITAVAYVGFRGLRKLFKRSDDAASKVARKNGRCFVKGTLVETDKGSKKIETIQVGSFVKTPTDKAPPAEKKQQAKQAKNESPKKQKSNKKHKNSGKTAQQPVQK
jgi:hypothetical protein